MTELPAAFVPALARTLLHFLWQGALVGATAALALQVLRDARPQARYALACLALLACLLLPLGTLLLELAPSVAAAAPGISSAAVGADARRAAVLPLASSLPGMSPSWIVLFWALGACAMALRMALGLAWLRGLPASPDRLLAAHWQARLDALAAGFGLRRRIVLRLVDALDTPAVFGAWRPLVLLPAALLARLPAELIEALLAHELAHIRRHDYLVNLLQSMVEALLFYHPVVWWLGRRIRHAREEAADQLAAVHACPPGRLAHALAALADLQASGGLPALAPAARGGSLLGRIERLAGPVRQARPAARGALVLAVLGAACIATLACAQVSVRAAPVAVAPDVPGVPRASPRDSYVLVRDGRLTAWGPRDSIDAEAAALGLQGDFFFAHRDGRFHLVIDAPLVDRTRRAWEAAERIDRELGALEASMEARQQRADAQDGTLGAVEARAAADARAALSRRANALYREQDRATERLGAELRDVLDDALANGAARTTSPPVAPPR
jgi:beta-lactamase regulating signal transducer with metallopeptidase domain